VVTGANCGIGYIAAKTIAKLKPKVVILACRDIGRGSDAEDRIK
jgi:NAD(P)-dependent dehydrogenase (short-subunit alcohol dehydrogenase family)